MPRTTPILPALLLLAIALPARAEFVTFESGQVRPLAMSPNGARLFAVNTPDNTLELFDVSGAGLVRAGSVPVGLEPVAVAARSDDEVWVVNHLSDSISIVDVAATPPRVVRTLLVGDEPRDVVFAGPGGNRAFVTTAHRGQNRPGDPQLTTPGVGRADVWVFDATALGAPLGGTPLTIVTLFADTPRALAVSPDGNTVYAAAFHSGNRTTTLHDGLVCDGGGAAGPCVVGGVSLPGGLPAPNVDANGVYQPEVGLIVKYDETADEWLDELGRDWSNAIRFSLPDHDVFAIDATATPPVETASFAGVGTVLFNMAVNPVTGRVYVTNTEARNDVRFEGPGHTNTTVRGRLHETRVTVLDGVTVTPRHLNKHIDYGTVPSPAGTAERSLAIPTGMAITQDGGTLYVAAFGSQKVGVFDTAALEADTFTPDAADHVVLGAGGPSGLVLDEAHGRLYVLTRFSNGIAVVDTATRSEIATVALHNPEPVAVAGGRPVLYDALLSSSNGEASCASCHIFGDFDSLSWDLGNPDDVVLTDPNPRRVPDPLGISFPNFHPMKGPMATQSLRGMANHGPMHWRGDRTGGNDIGGSSLDENAAFLKFLPAFDGLLGRDGPISAPDMQRFADFILQVAYPPNPIRALDNSLTPDQAAGRAKFFSAGPSDVFQNCNGCHKLDPAQGFFGSDGFSSFEFEVQFMKIPHLRNLYQKVGMFGMAYSPPFFNPGDNGDKGPQIRGFGFLHDGSTDTLFRFHNTTVFNRDNPGGFGFPVPNPDGFPPGPTGDAQRRQVEQFMLAFDSNLAPIVGQQTTRDAASDAAADARIDLLIARAAAGECDVVVKGVLDGAARGWVRLADGTFQSDRADDATATDAALRAQATVAGQARTFTCVPPGNGERIGVDRDGDGWYDRDELDAGTDPADPSSHPDPEPPPTFVLVPATALELAERPTGKRTVRFVSNTRRTATHVTPPARGSTADPTIAGAELVVYGSGGTDDAVTVALPASGWTALGSAAKPRGFRFRGKGLPLGIATVIVKTDRLLVKGGGAGWTYTLDEAQQGRVAVRLGLGDGDAWCAEAPAKAHGNPPSTAKSDRPGRFRGAPKAPAPAACPALPVVGSPAGAFLE